MESGRTFLWLTLGALCMFLFIEWSDQSRSVAIDKKPEISSTQPPIENVSDAQFSSESFQENLPSISTKSNTGSPSAVSRKTETINLSNSVLSILVDTRGADIVSAKLLKYYPSKNDQDNKVDLMYVNDTISDFFGNSTNLCSP